MTNPHAITEAEAIRKFGRGIVNLVLSVATINGVKMYSPSQLTRKRDEGPRAWVEPRPNNRERMRRRV